jgi:ABC-type transport system involved in multi-copper enzyme maturation permease subunit
MKLLAILGDTFREALARKTIIGFFAVSTFFLVLALIFALATDMSTLLAQSVQVRTQGGPVQQSTAEQMALMLPSLVMGAQAGFTGFIHFAALFLSVFATASIIPNALEKGSIDLLLSKPVSRHEILGGKYLGGLLIVIANVAWYVAGMFLIMSFETGYWNWGFLAVILPVSYSFAVLWAAMLPLGISTRSSALTIIILYAFLYFLSPLLAHRATILYSFISSETVRWVIDAVYYVLPKPDDLSSFAINLVLHRELDWMPVWTTALFGSAMAGLAWWLLRRKDF